MDLTKEQIIKIVNDQIKTFISNEFDKQLKKELSNSQGLGRKEMIEAIKKALIEFAKFTWMQKSTWTGQIK